MRAPSALAKQPASAPGDDLVIDTTTQTFAKDVLEASRKQPVLVDFWAPWCGPCRTLSPIIEKTVRAARGAVRLAKMDIDAHPAIAGQLGIQSIPAVIAFVNGQPADGFLGALPEGQVADFIARITKDKLGGEAQDLLKLAEEALTAGNAVEAVQLYAEVLKEEPSSVPALAGLARAYISTGATEQAKQTLALVPETKRNDPAVAAAHSALDVAEQAKSVGPVGELEQKVAANPADHQARFDLAVALNAAGKRTEAADQLLQIVKRDRKWNDDGARKQLVQFFEAWGPADEATVEGRRKLSSILFA